MRALSITKLYRAGETGNTKLIEDTLDSDDMHLKIAAIEVVRAFKLKLDADHQERLERYPVSVEPVHPIRLLARRVDVAWHQLLDQSWHMSMEDRSTNREYMLRMVARRGAIRHGFVANRNF